MGKSTALVTGATSGIGRATALLFAKHGSHVVAAGRNEEAGISLVDQIKAEGGNAIFIRTDISNDAEVANLVEKTKNHYGRLDYAINNAGIEGTLVTLEQVQEKEWDSVINTNLKGVWLCMKYEIGAMIANNGGVIVNISTNLTRHSYPTTGVYTASKAGVEALSRIAAVENGKYGIRINTISPGAVDTPMLRRIFSADDLTGLIKNNPLGKIATPQDIAKAIFWLCSSDCTHVNGANLLIDGGG